MSFDARIRYTVMKSSDANQTVRHNGHNDRRITDLGAAFMRKVWPLHPNVRPAERNFLVECSRPQSIP